MNYDDAFLRAILSSPEDAMPRLVYADWLEEQGDPRGELLRRYWDKPRINFLDWVAQRGTLDYYLELYPDLRGRLDEHDANRQLRERLAALGETVDPNWLALIDTLGHPFRPFFFWNNTGPRSFEQGDLPFRERIGTRGAVVTFESAFRGDGAWDPGLLPDLRFLYQLRLGECYYGAAGCPVHPFVCELGAGRPLTGADVLGALKAREFRSEHIQTLDATVIPHPGYHPNTDNDEIHNDPAEQPIFPRPDDAEDEGTGTNRLTTAGLAHEALTGYVDGGQLWYVLLHHHTPGATEGIDRHPWVILFAVGRSPQENRLVGVVSHQVCHNLCD